MAQRLDPKEIVSIEEVLMSQVIEQEALVNVLVIKGLIEKSEITNEIKRLRAKYMQ
ncbi:MAG: hypothetical protein ACW99F_12310 [Candidatus Hodarchaeales archaeon]|jgi:hypothetical protein